MEKTKRNRQQNETSTQGISTNSEIGYRGPAIVRGLHPTGLEPVVVHNVNELDKYNPGKHIVYIGGDVGLKKAIEIYKVAIEKGFKVANPPRI